MFTGTEGCGGEQNEVQSPEHAAVGVRDLGVKAMMGGWQLPVIPHGLFHQKIGSGLNDRYIAAFSLRADKRGLKLPSGQFTSLAQTIESQFQYYYRQQQLVDVLPMGLDIDLDENNLVLTGRPSQGIPVIGLKNVFESLELRLPGLGHFITSSIAMGHSAGMTTYDPFRIKDCACNTFFYGASTDEELARELQEYDGNDLPVPEGAELQEFLHQRVLITPSQLDKDLGPPIEQSPVKPLTRKTVEAVLAAGGLTQAEEKVLKNALEFRAIRRTLLKKAKEVHYEIDGYSQIGALALVVWSNVDRVMEIVEHHERDVYEGGEGEEVLFRITFDLAIPSEWDRAIETYKLLVRAYAVFSAMLTPMEIDI